MVRMLNFFCYMYFPVIKNDCQKIGGGQRQMLLFSFCFSPSVEPPFFCQTWMMSSAMSLSEEFSQPRVRYPCRSHWGLLSSGLILKSEHPGTAPLTSSATKQKATLEAPKHVPNRFTCPPRQTAGHGLFFAPSGSLHDGWA